MRASFILVLLGTVLATTAADLGYAVGDRPLGLTSEEEAQAEWKRWHALADVTIKTVPPPTAYLIPIELERFGRQSTWTRVLELCRDAGHVCELDTLVKELAHATSASRCCNDDGTGAYPESSYEDCHHAHCAKWIPVRDALHAKGQDQTRQVTAKISRRPIHTTENLPPKKI